MLVRSGYTVHFGLSDRSRAVELEQLVDTLAAGESPEVDDLVEHLELEQITGGEERAAQIARTVMRQKELLERRLPATLPMVPAPMPDVDRGADDPALGRPVRVTLGRGVAGWVNARGGRLYVWGDDFSPSSTL